MRAQRSETRPRVRSAEACRTRSAATSSQREGIIHHCASIALSQSLGHESSVAVTATSFSCGLAVLWRCVTSAAGNALARLVSIGDASLAMQPVISPLPPSTPSPNCSRYPLLRASLMFGSSLGPAALSFEAAAVTGTPCCLPHLASPYCQSHRVHCTASLPTFASPVRCRCSSSQPTVRKRSAWWRPAGVTSRFTWAAT